MPVQIGGGDPLLVDAFDELPGQVVAVAGGLGDASGLGKGCEAATGCVVGVGGEDVGAA